MTRDIVERIGSTEQHRLDEWFDQAMKDPTVMPYLGTSGNRPRLEVPDDDYTGVVLMNKASTGVMKLYFNHDTRTSTFGLWVLTPEEGGRSRRETALELVRTSMVVLEHHPTLHWIASKVKVSNEHGMNFSRMLMGEPWGLEDQAAYDRGWVDLAHFRASIDDVKKVLAVFS